MRKKWFQLLGTIIIAVSLTGCGNILTESSFDSEKEEDDFYTVNMVIIGKEQRDEARIETAMNKILDPCARPEDRVGSLPGSSPD